MPKTPNRNYRTPQKGSRHNPFRMQPSRMQIARHEMAMALREHRQIIHAMRDPSFELYDEEFAIISESVLRMLALGLAVDPFLVALVEVLRRQVINTSNDSDMDGPNLTRLEPVPEFF